jgi:molybdenum cofactor cytidylyltransferase
MVRTIILAAGSSTRMGRPKALLEIGSLTFLAHILRNHQALGLPVTVVLGEHRAEIQAGVDLSDAVVLVNPHPELGPLSSLKIGLLSSEDNEAVLVHPVDHPLVRVESLQALLESHRGSPQRIIVPLFGARRGHPVLFPRLFFKDLLAAPLDQGARYVVRRYPETVIMVKVPDEGVIHNIDTPEDYSRLISSKKLD